MKHIPVHMAKGLRAEGMAWRDVSQEIAWATGRKFSFDSVQSAVYSARGKVLQLPWSVHQQHSATLDAMIDALWGLKLDTVEIAKALRLPQARVANRLAMLRDMARPA